MATTPEPVRPQPRSPESCTEGGDRLALRTCRRGNDLEWTITNRLDVPLWAFVAPQSARTGQFTRENVIARSQLGTVVLTKMEPPPYGGERHPAGAVLLQPGESDHGTIPVGERLDLAAGNYVGISVNGSTWVLSVTLEVGFAERQPKDAPHPIGNDLVAVIGFQRAKQEMVRAPAVPWR